MPKLSVVFHPAAIEEAWAAREWYAARSQSAAELFLAELDGGVLFDHARGGSLRTLDHEFAQSTAR